MQAGIHSHDRFVYRLLHVFQTLGFECDYRFYLGYQMRTSGLYQRLRLAAPATGPKEGAYERRWWGGPSAPAVVLELPLSFRVLLAIPTGNSSRVSPVAGGWALRFKNSCDHFCPYLGFPYAVRYSDHFSHSNVDATLTKHAFRP